MSFLSNISSWLFSPAAAVESTSTVANSPEVASAPSPLAHRRAPTGDEWEHLSDGVNGEVEQKRHDERVAAVAQAVTAWAALAHRLRENSPPTSAATSPQTSTMSALTLGAAASAAASSSSSSDEDTDDRVPSADGDADAGVATLDSDYALALQLDETLNGAASASAASVDVRAPAPTLDEDTLLPGDVILTAAPRKVPLGARQTRHVAHVSETQRARMRVEEAVAKQVKMFAEHRLRAANDEHYKPLLAERRIERMLTKIVRNGETRSRSAWTHQNAARKLKADTVTVE